MKPDFMEEYQSRVIEPTRPNFHDALHTTPWKASSLADFRDETLITQSEPKNGGILSPLRKFSDTFKRKKDRKPSVPSTTERKGSLSSDSGGGSMSDGHPTTHSPSRSIITSSEQARSQQRKTSDRASKDSAKSRLPSKLRPSRRFSSPATSPTKQTFDHVDFGVTKPLKSNLQPSRQRGLSWPDIKRWDHPLARPGVTGGDNRITNTNIRHTGGFDTTSCLEAVDEECYNIEDASQCLGLTHPARGKDSKSSVVLISDHNQNEQELIELNKLLDKETLRVSATILDEEGMTLLHRAVQNGFVALAKFLITSGVSTEIKDAHGWTALYLALEIGNYVCAEMLVRLGANVNFANKGGETVLHRMAQEGDYKAVQFLVKNGANLNNEDEKGWPALHYCLKRKDLKCAALLMTSGANIHRYTERRVEEYSISMEIVNIGKVRVDNTLQKLHRDSIPEVTII